MRNTCLISYPLNKTCSQYGKLGYNMITCGRLSRKTPRPHIPIPLPIDTTPYTSNVPLMYKVKVGKLCSAPTYDNFQSLRED